ncbi:MAG: aspartate aminotransferase family protein [Deltaproteobacteria bacterium]|nr:aspartate aminotransferase family protein [Deltaproteobacteria bacterium]MBW1959950.1 aspartate aminotransferase family protein [Deltaproteobacteria bacterium]MBW1995911.1 aspartate aminotransferase family protein [Deltaproteobacteria bacterium]MBW2150178.1 aspartate aminotransferase family protein [Deltaproteobacteria bacterium]
MNQRKLLEKADQYLVGGTIGAMYLPPEAAMVFSHGRGTKLYDVDGTEYIDFLLGSGPLILGHCHPAVVEAVQQQIQKGSTFYNLNEPAIQLAQKVVEASPCGEKVRFVCTGTDAVLYAIRMARAFTGREKILKFEGGWHGLSDYALHSCRPQKTGEYPRAVPDSAGIPASVAQHVLVSPFNDRQKAGEIIDDHKDELAAVVVEPLQRCIRPEPGFLESLKDITSRYGIILIFDEVVTGFRLAWGGAAQRYGVVPDIAAYGKTLSGGYPLGAICGRADVMNTANPRLDAADPKKAVVTGTFNGYPVSAAAGLATLNELEKQGTYERLYEMGNRIVHEVEEMGREMSVSLKVAGEGPVLQVLFTEDEQILNYESMLRADKKKAYRFGIEMIKRGFFVSPFEKIYLSVVHSDADIDRFLEATRDVFKQVISRM